MTQQETPGEIDWIDDPWVYDHTVQNSQAAGRRQVLLISSVPLRLLPASPLRIPGHIRDVVAVTGHPQLLRMRLPFDAGGAKNRSYYIRAGG